MLIRVFFVLIPVDSWFQFLKSLIFDYFVEIRKMVFGIVNLIVCETRG